MAPHAPVTAASREARAVSTVVWRQQGEKEERARDETGHCARVGVRRRSGFLAKLQGDIYKMVRL